MKKKTYGFGISDMPRGGCFFLDGKKKTAHKYYRDWHNMLRRAYSDGGTYEDVSVCDEWALLSNFKSWHDDNYIDGWELDKDMIPNAKREYSPSTCCFLPKPINLIFCDSESHRGEYHAGISMCKDTGLYKCRTSENGKEVWLGRHSSLEFAISLYNKKKLEISIRKLERYIDVIDPVIYSHIMHKMEIKYE